MSEIGFLNITSPFSELSLYLSRRKFDSESDYRLWKAAMPHLFLDLDEETGKIAAPEYTRMETYLGDTNGAYMDSIKVNALAVLYKMFKDGKTPNTRYSPMAVCEELTRLIKECANRGFDFDYEVEIVSVVVDAFSYKKNK
jgi:hypothetical protein